MPAEYSTPLDLVRCLGGGCFAIVVTGDLAHELAGHLKRENDRQLWDRKSESWPPPFVRALGLIRPLEAAGSANATEPGQSLSQPSSFMTVAEVVTVAGVAGSTVRKRLARGAAGPYPGAGKRGGRWLIPTIEVFGSSTHAGGPLR
jgi:hypothetical protein